MPDPGFGRLIQPVLSRLDLELAPVQISRLSIHYATLQHWNQRINLTSITEPAEIAEKHFGESLFVAKSIRSETGTLVDVGSGAGFPGIPIAVCKPRFQVTLVESVGKKATFLKEVARALDLHNVTVFHGRVEELQGHFNWASSRGVASGRLFDVLAVISDAVALLVGRSGAEEVSSSPLFRWQPPVHGPWGRNRVLLIGYRRTFHVKHEGIRRPY